jgi:hypothetical protein
MTSMSPVAVKPGASLLTLTVLSVPSLTSAQSGVPSCYIGLKHTELELERSGVLSAEPWPVELTILAESLRGSALPRQNQLLDRQASSWRSLVMTKARVVAGPFSTMFTKRCAVFGLRKLLVGATLMRSGISGASVLNASWPPASTYAIRRSKLALADDASEREQCLVHVR